jgi:glycosyltransferase involved in cell wall biosynthesis
MFQYAQSILDALRALPKQTFTVTAAYADPLWRDYLARYPFKQINVAGGRRGLRMADALMVARLPGPVCRYISRWANPIVRALRSAKCDLWIFPAQDAVSYQAQLSALVTIHDLMHRYEPRFPEVSAWGRYGIREQRFRGIVKWAAGIVVDSETGRHHVVESYQADRTRVFPLPYVAPRSNANSTKSVDFDERYRLPQKFFFYPAQFWEHKNHVRLLSALAALRAELPDVHLVLCGAKKSGYTAVRRHVESLGLSESVTFKGYVSDCDIPEFYRRARALVMPTFFGPTNIPPLEAFELGCPVAISDVYGMPEQVGDAALLFDPSSTEEMGACMRRLWQDDVLCSELRQKGFRRAQNWNQARFDRAFQDILQSVLGVLRTDRQIQ